MPEHVFCLMKGKEEIQRIGSMVVGVQCVGGVSGCAGEAVVGRSFFGFKPS